jgi:hypothetical protein
MLLREFLPQPLLLEYNGISMKYNMKSMVVSLTLFVALLAVGYMVVANTETVEVSQGGVSEGLVATSARYDDFLKDQLSRASKLQKYNLLGEIVSTDDYGIVDDSLVIDMNTLFSRDGWIDFDLGKNGIRMQYPKKGWYLQTTGAQEDPLIVLTTTKSGKVEKGVFAKVTIGVYSRTFDQTLFDWMEDPGVTNDDMLPPNDNTLQYVTVGESTFLGSVFFDEYLLTGVKNVYAEVSSTEIFAATLEVQNVEESTDNMGVYDRIFYTILESLEVK